jgi:peptidyl-prolyl cis-trans isomerase A (cyclophilin A)
MKFALALLALAAPAAAQTDAPPTDVPVVIRTEAGDITVALDKAHAPRTTANFLRYVDAKRFDGVTFYRAMKIAPDLGLIQGGVSNDPKRAFPPVVHEPTTQTGLRHIDGVISMPRGAPGSANGDFFITVGAIPSLDADPTKPGDNAGFAAFGHVTAGMDVVHRILDQPTSPSAGAGVMKGQMLAPPVRIVSVRRATAPAPAPH